MTIPRTAPLRWRLALAVTATLAMTACTPIASPPSVVSPPLAPTAAPVTSSAPTPALPATVAGTASPAPTTTAAPVTSSRPAATSPVAVVGSSDRANAIKATVAAAVAAGDAADVLPTGTPWSDAASWSGGVPAPGSAVTIPAGKVIVLDRSVELASLEVQGVLTFADTADVSLTTGSLMVHGDGAKLAIGTAAQPHQNTATITLTGPRSDADLMGGGSKVLMAMGGGEISLHGASAAKTGWVKLAATADVGANTLQLSEAPGWAVGDRIAVSPGGLDPTEVDEVTITSVNGSTVGVTPALAYRHGGEFDVVDGKQIDTRSEVGLLSRNIVIQGDESSDESKFGGHTMIMSGGTARIEGVQFQRMGQQKRLGRYPLHWHRAVEGLGNYVRDSSLTHNFQRGVVLHETNRVLVDGNVAHDTFSHSFVGSEDPKFGPIPNPAREGVDGVENVLTNNLSMLTRLMPRENLTPEAHAALSKTPERFQDEHRASGFWFSKMSQVVEGNVAAGSTGGNGFMYTSGDSSDMMFANNTAHANFQGNSANPIYPPTVAGFGLFTSPGTNRFDTPGTPDATYAHGLIAHHNNIAGVWLEGTADGLADSALIANGRGTLNFHDVIVRDTVISGTSVNTGDTSSIGSVVAPDRRAAFVNQAAQGGPTPRVTRYHNITVADMPVLVQWGSGSGAGRYADPVAIPRFSEISVVGRAPTTRFEFSKGTENTTALLDLDGTLSGVSGPRVVGGSQATVVLGGGCTAAPVSAYLCPVPNGVDVASLRLP